MKIAHFLTLALVAIGAACSGSAAPALSDDLKQDLARAGGTEMPLAGSVASRVDVVSAAERNKAQVPTPRAPTVARAPTPPSRPDVAEPGTPAEVRASSQSPVRAEDGVPAGAPTVEPPPSISPAAGRPQAPQPSTQREPRGGWRTPGDVIRRAPFPINP